MNETLHSLTHSLTHSEIKRRFILLFALVAGALTLLAARRFGPTPWYPNPTTLTLHHSGTVVVYYEGDIRRAGCSACG